MDKIYILILVDNLRFHQKVLADMILSPLDLGPELLREQIRSVVGFTDSEMDRGEYIQGNQRVSLRFPSGDDYVLFRVC